MRSSLLWLAAMLVAAPVTARAQRGPAPAGPLVISSPGQAVAAALAGSPALRGAGASRQAVRGDALTAPLRPNPEASVLVENFGGLGGRADFRGGRAAETTVGVSQRIELGGKRAARIGLAGRNGEVAGLDYEAARLDLARDVLTALAEATAAARNIKVEQERVTLADLTVRIARARVDAGREPLLQLRRAEVTRSNAETSAERARREADASLRNLSVLIGAPAVELAPQQAWFEDVGPAPRPAVPTDPILRLAANPDLARLEAAIVQQRANVDLQRANAVPDVSVQGHFRRFEDGRQNAFVAGVSIPLPIHDRNQGGIARAQAELLRAEAEAERGRLALVASLVNAERRIDLAWRTVSNLRRTALPAAEQATRLATIGFAEGKFTFLEVLDTQRALSDTRAQLNDALREFHVRRAEADRLRGRQPGAAPAGDYP